MDKPETSLLYPGEEIRMADGYPALVRFNEGDARQPLVVFITGGGVLARIAYGHPQAKAEDFLAFWLHQAGYPFLAISYPLDNPVFDTVYPEFSVRNWGRQAAEIIHQVLEENKLSRQVIVLGWSMAGRIAESINTAARQWNFNIDFFVPLAAIPPIPNLLPALDQIRPSPRGLADGATFFPWLWQCLNDQSEMNGHTLISKETFYREFIGDFPINLVATTLRYRNKQFLQDNQEDFEDTQVWNYSGFPLVALIIHNSPLDPRHALMDRGVWSLYISQVLYQNYLVAQGADFTSLSPNKWQQLVDLVRTAPDQLSTTVRGNHFFFVGELGARATVDGLNYLRQQVKDLLERICQVLGI